MRELFSYLIDAVIPPRTTERVVRALTLEQLAGLSGDGPLPYHEPRVTALVWELKYHAQRRACALAAAYLSEIVLSACAEELGAPLLVPVPMHPERKRARGHNHTETLCRALLPFVGAAVEYAPKGLRRITDTPTQQGLPRARRLENVAYAMVGSPQAAGRACIVIDDVTTTGATLEEAKRALLTAGARVVHTIALARS